MIALLILAGAAVMLTRGNSAAHRSDASWVSVLHPLRAAAFDDPTIQYLMGAISWEQAQAALLAAGLSQATADALHEFATTVSLERAFKIMKIAFPAP